MTAKESESGDKGREAPSDELAAERASLSYEGARVPWFVTVLWLLFLCWGVYYLLRWIPESWREWFSRG